MICKGAGNQPTKICGLDYQLTVDHEERKWVKLRATAYGQPVELNLCTSAFAEKGEDWMFTRLGIRLKGRTETGWPIKSLDELLVLDVCLRTLGFNSPLLLQVQNLLGAALLYAQFERL